MEDEIDEIDQILRETNAPKENPKILTYEFWKNILTSIWAFIYFFFYSLIHPVRNPENQENTQNSQNQTNNGRNTRDLLRRPPGFRYRSRGGG